MIPASPTANPANRLQGAGSNAALRLPGKSAAKRAFFAKCLWQAFPARSEYEVACLAARALGVSTTRVRGWLAGQHDAKLTEVLAVLALAGFELVHRGEGSE